MLKIIFEAYHVQADVDTEASARVQDEGMAVPVDADTQTALDTFLSQECSSGQQAGQDAVRSAIIGNK
eukprot:5603364-Karenia_brevis.AAC.1